MQDVLRQAFLAQARACDDLGSPFMGRLMRAMPEILPADIALARRFAAWQGEVGPSGASLPLRLAGGLHSLVLTGQDAALGASYPPLGSTPDLVAVAGALHRHDAFLADWVGNAPQTNEVGRSAVLLAGAAAVASWLGLPLEVAELGASAGLNLNFSLYRVESHEIFIGNPKADLVLRPDWRGNSIANFGPVPVQAARGVDLNPLSPASEGLRLLSYVWPDQADRLARMRAALAIAARHPPKVDRGDAADWLLARLAQPHPGRCLLVCHTIAFQYFPANSKAQIEQAMAAAGAVATKAAPLAWLGMEADDAPQGAAITLRLWPGDLRIPLGRAGFHGQWIDWLGM
jgi:hypothetical protein